MLENSRKIIITKVENRTNSLYTIYPKVENGVDSENIPMSII